MGLTGGSIFVTGQGCDSLVYQTGGWTYHWQGAVSDDEFSRGTTILDGIQQLASSRNIAVHYNYGVDLKADSDANVDYDTILPLASSSSVIIMCVGETAYAEKPGDIDDLALPAGQVQYANKLHEQVNPLGIPIITVLVEGRPRLLGAIPDQSTSMVHALYQGPVGGISVSEVIFGLINPSGKLPFTYPKHAGDVPLPYHRKPSQKCTNPDNGFQYIDCDVEYWFGHGLSYTSFDYSQVTLSSSVLDWNGDDDDAFITATVVVTNTGSRAGSDVVMMFLTDVYRRVTPEYKLLKGFERISLQVGESKSVSFQISVNDLGYYGLESRLVYESGEFRVGIGASTDCRADSWSDNDQCASFEFAVPSEYNPICDASCNLLAPDYFHKSSTCHEKCLAESIDVSTVWSWDLVTCLENAKIRGSSNLLSNCRDVTLTSFAPSKGSVSSSSKFELYAISLGVGLAGIVVGLVAGTLLNKKKKKKGTNDGYLNLNQDESF